MIHLSNTRFGNISIENSAAIEFPRGIIGFSDETQFAILERENGPIAYLQSLKNPKLALPILDANMLKPDYPDSSRAEMAAAVNAKEENLAILVVVHVDKSDGTLRANLLAPIVVDSETRKAWQVILDPEKYTANAALSGPRDMTTSTYATTRSIATTDDREATDCAVDNNANANESSANNTTTNKMARTFEHDSNTMTAH